MTPGVAPDERQMGCMAGFLHIFDRHQILAGKRPYAAKRLYPAAGSTSPSERSESSSVSSSFVMRDSKPEAYSSSPETRGQAEVPAKPEQPPPVLEFKDGLRSSRKLREAPRLSLDSRAIVDGKGKLRPRDIRTSGNPSDAGDDIDKQRRSPSVVARLMGLEVLPGGGAAVEKTAELRRSASESRVSRDSSLFRFVESSTFQKAPPPGGAAMYRAAELGDSKPAAPARTSLAASLQRKSFFDAQDFFPEPKRTGSLYGEIERRLRMRGIDEPAKDLETLKQVLEALQLKGLLHSNLEQQDNRINGLSSRRDIDRRYPQSSPRRGDSPIVVMRPAARSPRRPGSESPPTSTRSSPPLRRSSLPESGAPLRARRVETERSPRGRSPRSPDRPEASRCPTPAMGRRTGNATPPPPQRRSPVHSPRTSPKRTGPDSLAIRSPRNRQAMPESSRNDTPAVEDDSSSTIISEGSISNSSNDKFERSKEVNHRAGWTLLDRCDKLLHSIAAITSSPAEQLVAADQQPSPVSVLDAGSFLGGVDESSPSPSPSPAVDFKDQPGNWEEDHWPPSVRFLHVDGCCSTEDPDLAYVSEILTESARHADVYAALEKRHQRSPSTELHRRLLFDVVAEILDRRRSAPTWDSAAGPELLRQVWAEVQRAGEGVLSAAGDLNDVTCGAIRKDMAAAGDRGWGGACAAEISNVVLYIERQIFKDLVADTIRDLAAVAPPPPRRKLLF